MPQKNKSKNDNPKAFKHWINEDLLQRMADSIKNVHAEFNLKEFVKVGKKLEPLEMKARVQLIREQLYLQLPRDYDLALNILIQSCDLGKLKGFDLWPYTEFIQTYGLNHSEKSLLALARITTLFTGEFAVRPFLKNNTKQTLAYLMKCTEDKNVHIRRWVSEGTRPRLPWGERLHIFIQNPNLTLSLLEILKHDEEIYVRKSVANHLNDIAKDHPQLVVATLSKWKTSATKEHAAKINWIIHRSLRTLIKNGNPQALKLIGVSQNINILVNSIKINKRTFRLGERLELKFKVTSKSTAKQNLVIDYLIHFAKANNKISKKVFKLKKFTLSGRNKIEISKIHHLKPITTRTYYSGKHFIELQINGKPFGKIPFNLHVQKARRS
ncbi:MAG: DNA alkylation repair protein [Bdellovibrionota bacterium]